MPAAEFEPAFPASKHPQAYALDHAATGVNASTAMKKKIPASFTIIPIPPSIHPSHAQTLYSANSSENECNNDFYIWIKLDQLDDTCVIKLVYLYSNIKMMHGLIRTTIFIYNL